MAIKYVDIKPAEEPEKTKQHPAEKIMEGLREALAIAKGEAEPSRWHFRPRAPNKSFDKKAYMREYMKLYRQKAKRKKENNR